MESRLPSLNLSKFFLAILCDSRFQRDGIVRDISRIEIAAGVGFLEEDEKEQGLPVSSALLDLVM